MSSLEEIDKNLSRITKELDSMWRDVRDHVPDQEKTPVADLGTAINSLNDIRNCIYKIQPNLKPKTWNRE